MRRLYSLLIALLFFAIGLCTGYFGRQLLTIEFKKEFGLSDLLSFVTTIAIGLIVGNYLQQRYSNARVEKDLLIEDIKDVVRFTQDVRNIYWDCFHKQQISPDARVSMLAVLRNIANALTQLEKSLNDCKKTVGTLSIQAIKESYYEYKAVLTGGNFPKEPYSGRNSMETEKAYLDFRAKLQSLIFTINSR